MKAKDKASLLIRVVEYGLNHDSFSLDEIQKKLTINTTYEIEYLRNVLAAKDLNPNPNNILGISEPHNYWNQPSVVSPYESKYSLLPTAYFSYVDHLEIVLARENAEIAKKNAKEAHEQSLIANDQSKEANSHARRAIRISMWALILTALVGLIQIALQLFQMLT